MSDAISDATERARDDLARLTGAECEVLYWLCKGLEPEEIAKRVNRSDSTVHSHLTSIYAKFGLQDLHARTRFYAFDKIYCPLHEKLVKDPERDCRRTRKPRTKSPQTSDQGADRGHPEVPPSTGDEGADAGEESIEEPATPPDPRISAIVKRDEEQGIIPLQRTIILRQQDLVPIPPRDGGKPVSERPCLPYVLVGLVGVLIGAVLLYAIMSQPPGPGPATSTPQSTPQQQPGSGARPSATSVSAAVSDVQNPAPGSVITAGQAFSRSGVTVTARRDLDISRNYVSPFMEIRNGGSDQLFVRWKPSFFHLQDSAGRVYHQMNDDTAAYNDAIQFTLAPGESMTLHGSDVYALSSLGYQTFGWFLGPIDPSVKQLDFKVDEIASLTSLTWRFSLP